MQTALTVLTSLLFEALTIQAWPAPAEGSLGPNDPGIHDLTTATPWAGNSTSFSVPIATENNATLADLMESEVAFDPSPVFPVQADCEAAFMAWISSLDWRKNYLMYHRPIYPAPFSGVTDLRTPKVETVRTCQIRLDMKNTLPFCGPIPGSWIIDWARVVMDKCVRDQMFRAGGSVVIQFTSEPLPIWKNTATLQVSYASPQDVSR